jgi:hypothetical protein
MTAVSGSWWSGPYDHRGVAVADNHDGTPNGFHVLSVDGNRYTTRFQPAKEPNARQVRIVLDSPTHRAAKDSGDVRMSQRVGSPIAQDNAGATDLVVNVFDGGPRTSVAYQIGERPAVRMERERRVDPFVREVFARNQEILGQGRAVLASVGRAPARGPRSRHPLHQGAGHRRIRSRTPRPPGAGGGRHAGGQCGGVACDECGAPRPPRT